MAASPRSTPTDGVNRFYRCKHRGKGCQVPGRTASGLHRAARLGIELLRTDDHLIEAIRAHLAAKAGRTGGSSAQPSRAGALASLRAKRQKLLDLMLADKISDDYFAEQEHQLTAKINALTTEHSQAVEVVRKHYALADAFEMAATLLRDPSFHFTDVWDNASARERRVLVEELVESVTIYADRLEVTVAGAPPLLVTFEEVGLRESGTGPVVSEGGLDP